MRWLSKLTPMFIAAAINASPAEQPALNRRFESATCGYSVAYPSSWHVLRREAASERSCSVSLRPLDFERRLAEYDVDIHTLRIDSGAGGFEEGADAVGFEVVGAGLEVEQLTEPELEHLGERVIYGRHGMITVPEPVNVGEYWGLKGYAVVGCHYQGGGYAGLCEVPRAFLTNGRRWISLDAGAGVEIFDDVLNNVCLDTPAN